jgi:hypothetical protein
MKLITWNVQWFCGLDGRVDVARVVQHARAMADFDVLCLQEVAVNYPRLKGDASHDQPALLRSLLPGFEVCFGAAVDELADDGSGRRRFGNVIASRLPVAQLQHHALPYPPAPGLRSMPRMATCATVRRALGAAAGDDHAPGVLLAAAAPGADPRAAAPARPGGRAGRAATRWPTTAAAPSRPSRTRPTASSPPTSTSTPAARNTALLTGDNGSAPRLHDAWRLVHGDSRSRPPSTCTTAPTARCRWRATSSSPAPGLAPRVRRISVDSDTTVSDHQPVLLELD